MARRTRKPSTRAPDGGAPSSDRSGSGSGESGSQEKTTLVPAIEPDPRASAPIAEVVVPAPSDEVTVVNQTGGTIHLQVARKDVRIPHGSSHTASRSALPWAKIKQLARDGLIRVV